MLIDISRYPLVLIPEECSSGIILRTVSAKGVSGTVFADSYTVSNYRQAKKEQVEVPPTEQLPRAFATFLETRLPIQRAKEIAPIACVFEAASALSSSLDKDQVAAWRVKLSVLYKLDSNMWHITAWDVSRSVPVLLITTRQLNPDAVAFGENSTPLARIRKAMGAEVPQTCWTRLLDDD